MKDRKKQKKRDGIRCGGTKKTILKNRHPLSTPDQKKA